MVTAFADPFDALFNLQTAVEARTGSEWLQNQTASQGQFPPTNVFTQGDGVNKNDLQTQDALTVILEMPDVEKNNVSVRVEDVRVEDGVLHVQGQLDLSKYQGLQPLYTEYNIGPYAELPAFQPQDRAGQNRRRVEGWRPYVDAAEGRRSKASKN